MHAGVHLCATAACFYVSVKLFSDLVEKKDVWHHIFNLGALLGYCYATEGRPIESLWDVTTAVTAIARTVPFQNERVDLERQAGDIMAMAA